MYTWLWVKDRYPEWNPGKWTYGRKPAGPCCFNFDSYSHLHALGTRQRHKPCQAPCVCSAAGAATGTTAPAPPRHEAAVLGEFPLDLAMKTACSFRSCHLLQPFPFKRLCRTLCSSLQFDRYMFNCFKSWSAKHGVGIATYSPLCGESSAILTSADSSLGSLRVPSLESGVSC